MHLNEWLQHIESLGLQRHRQDGTSYELRKKRFEEFKKFTSNLGLLTHYGTVITVAGTNGKGTCVAALVAILKAAGYTVGSYTSPHLVTYNERIQINGVSVKDSELCSVFEAIESNRHNLVLGYPEFSTLAALLLFKQTKLDFIILEVGIGGRFSTVNVLDSDVAIVSSIDYDHMHLLGNTLEKIAFEKIGIVRPFKPCIWGNLLVPNNIVEYVKQLRVSLQVQNKDFGVAHWSEDLKSFGTWTWWNKDLILKNLLLTKQGYLPNLACVLQALHAVNTLPSVEVINEGLQKMYLPGRFQIIPGKVTQIFDVAHNPASAQLLADNLLNQNFSGRILNIVGILSTKDVKNTLQPLITVTDQWYLGALADSHAISTQELIRILKEYGVKNYCSYSTLQQAYQTALQDAQPHDVIVVWGSFRTVGAILKQSFKDFA